jgi:hypothetical protein
MRRLLQVSLAGALLIGLSTFQGEYDFAVPQFRLILHPVLLMLAASIALVAARAYAGPGAALAAALFFIAVRGALSLLAVLVYAVPMSDGERIRASVQLTDVDPAPERNVHATVRLDPPDAADGAHWFVSTAWQGREGRSVVDPLEEIRPGVWRTTKPVPVYGTWKASVRLQDGSAVQGLALYFPEDEAIPVEAIPARRSFTRQFVRDKELLQREQKPGVSPALTTSAYLIVGLIAVLLVAALTAGVVRLSRTAGRSSRTGTVTT